MAETRLYVFRPTVKRYEGIGIAQAVGAAKTRKFIPDTTPPVVDNSRYVRPTLDDDYI